MECGKCCLAVSVDKIGCAGFCGNNFHLSCAAVDRACHRQSFKCGNILWFCDECRELVSNRTFKNIYIKAKSWDNLNQDFVYQNLLEEIKLNRLLIENVLELLNIKDTRIPEAILHALPSAIKPLTTNIASCNNYNLVTSTSDVASTVSTDFMENNFCNTLGTINSIEAFTTLPIQSDVDSTIVTTSLSSTYIQDEFTTIDPGSSQTFAEVVMSRGSTSIIFELAASEQAIFNSVSTEVKCLDVPYSNALNVSTNSTKIIHLEHTKMIHGTNESVESFGIKTINVPKMFWIHLFRFDPTTKEEDILGMAKSCLQTEVCKVHKLITINSGVQKLEYVCFKLGCRDDLEVKALDPATWPVGVYIKPFEFTNFRSTRPAKVKFWTSASIPNPS